MKFIIDAKPNLRVKPLDKMQVKELSNYILTLEEVKKLLDTISFQTRMGLAQYHKLDILTSDLTGHCIEATRRVCYGFGNVFDIVPYETQNIFNKNINHSFAVASLDTIEGLKRYIIDVTYRQFCTQEKCSDEAMFKSYIAPGRFFANLPLLKQLLRDGYLEITEESLVNYGDSFVLSGMSFENSRQGKFIIPTSTSYTFEDYNHTLETGKMLTKIH